MASIKHHQAKYSVLSSTSRSREKSSEEMLKAVEGLISERRIDNFDIVDLKGWLAFQFDARESRIIQEPISKGRIKDGLVATHLETKPIPYPEEISKIIRDQNISFEVKRALMEHFSRKFFNDFIFVEQPDHLKIIMPTENTEWVTNRILVPAIGKEFSIKDVDTMHVPFDLLLWLVFKIKKRMNGNLQKMEITSIEDYSAFARGAAGNLAVEIDDAERNLFTQISAGKKIQCIMVGSVISYKNRDYPFCLYEGGVFQPIWRNFERLRAKNYISQRIIDVQKIALEIIPQIVEEYRNDTDWPDERDDILREELTDAKKRL